MSGFIDAIRATLAEMAGADHAPPCLTEHLPGSVRPLAEDAVQQLIDYQGPGYAQLYLDRLRRFLRRRDVSDDVLREIARLLAERMCYQDLIRIAQQVLLAAGGGEPGATLRPIVEVHRLRVDELVTALPTLAASPLLSVLEWLRWEHRTLRIRFSSKGRIGIRRLKITVGLRRWRLLSIRYAKERALVERWLHMIDRSLTRQPAATMAVVQTATMLRGFGAHYRHHVADWNLIIDSLAKPVFDGALTLPDLAAAIAEARAAAVPDQRQLALKRAIAEIRARAAAVSPPTIAGAG